MEKINMHVYVKSYASLDSIFEIMKKWQLQISTVKSE